MLEFLFWNWFQSDLQIFSVWKAKSFVDFCNSFDSDPPPERRPFVIWEENFCFLFSERLGCSAVEYLP